jgi:Do/DeqQ family serine protease
MAWLGVGADRARLLGLAAAGVAALALGGAPLSAQQREVPPSREAARYSFAAIVKRTAPAVVNVYVRGQARTFVSPFADDPIFRRFFGEFGMPQERVQSSLGSGVIVSGDGVVVTNAHVLKVAGTAQISVVLADRREFNARVLLADEKTDIAVLRIEGGPSGHPPYPHLEFADSDAAEVGDMVLAIGNPFGVGQTVTSGIISALGRTQVTRSDAQAFIQTDAAINPGNSGGALVDMAGRVVGINTAIYTKSGGSQGIGFAIPADLVKLVVEGALTGRKLERPWLGAKLETVTRELADELKLGRVAGAVVARLQDKGPAAEAGLKAGDVIVGVDGHEVDDARAVHYRLTTRGIGNRAQLEVIRKGRPAKLELALRSAPSGAQVARDLAGAHPLDGARVANILPGTAEELGIDADEGVVVVSVKPQTTAARLGFRPGDVIVQVGRERIGSVAELENLLRQRQRSWLVLVKRGNQLLQLQMAG